MNKTFKLILISVFVVGAGYATFKFVDFKNQGVTEKQSKSSDSQEKTPSEKSPVADQKSDPEGDASSESTENSKKDNNVESTKEGKNEEEASASSEELNSQSAQESKKDGTTVVLFKDGTTVTDAEVAKDLADVPDQLSSRMSLTEIKSFLAWKRAYNKLVTEAALRSGIMESAEIRKVIEKRKKTAAGFMLLDEKAKELMTFDALKQNYDKVWDKNFKGTKEFSLIAITTADKAVSEEIKKNAKDEASLKQLLSKHSAKVKTMDMDSRPQGMFPPEITEAVLKMDSNSSPVVGPFEIRGSFMLFYVKSVQDAKKKEFTKEFAEEYKKVAQKDFIKEYTQTLYKKYDVKVMDIDGKTVDPFEAIKEKGSEKDQEADLVKISKLQDDAVLATYKGGKVTVKELKDFYKVDKLLDQTFISMAQQFNIGLGKVLVYAAKLVMDDEVLAAEVSATGYDKEQKVIDKLIEVGNMETQHAYFKEHVKVKSEDIKQAFDKFMKAIPEEDKNDNEISVKLAFYETKEDAEKVLQSISSGEEKFTAVYKDKSEKKEAIDLGYVRKRGTSPELWTMLKTGASGACCKQIVELKGEQFGVPGKNFVIIYIADRRPVTLPSLSNPAEKKYFQRLAERDKAIELAKGHLVAGIKKIEGKALEEIIKTNPDYVNRMISVLMGYAG